MIIQSRSVIAVKDLVKSAQFYHDVLGFNVSLIEGEGWAFYERDSCVIMAGECRDALSPAETGDHSYFAYLEVDDVDDWARRLSSNGVEFVKRLRTEPWGMREFGIRTIDGHRIMFGESTPHEQGP